MNMDDIVLLAYVDGELTPEERLEVEKAVNASTEIAERVALLEASKLPYREVYARQKLPPIPDSLKQKIAALTDAYSSPQGLDERTTSTGGMGASANDPVGTDAPSPVPRAAQRGSRMRVALPWLAVAFIAGAFSCGIVFRFAPGAGSGSFLQASNSGNGPSPWVRAAATYQQFYSRDMVALHPPSPDASARVVSEIRHVDGLELRVPDLRSMGLTFMRVQRLTFNDRPLVQMVYLPQSGPPVALCVVKEAKPDAAVSQRRVDGMDVVTWRQGELSYALIAAPGTADLHEIGKQIAGSNVGAMFG